jgi:hypothetical protein
MTSAKGMVTMQRSVVLISLLLLCASGFLPAQSKIQKIELADITGNAPEQTKKEILAIEEEHSKAVFDQDRSELEKRLLPDWAYTNERGEVLSKEQWINNIMSRKFMMDRTIHDQIRMDQFGDTVIVMGRSLSTLHYQNKISKGPRRFELVFVKVNGDWKLAGHFVALVPND